MLEDLPWPFAAMLGTVIVGIGFTYAMFVVSQIRARRQRKPTDPAKQN